MAPKQNRPQVLAESLASSEGCCAHAEDTPNKTLSEVCFSVVSILFEMQIYDRVKFLRIVLKWKPQLSSEERFDLQASDYSGIGEP